MNIDWTEVTASRGFFQIGRWQGREYLFYKGSQVAECLNGDSEERYGGLVGWIKHVRNRAWRRVKKIDDQVSNLCAERETQIEIALAASSL